MTHGQIKEEMRKTLSPKRFSHTLAVAEETEILCEIFEICEKNTLITAALLHDCTKDYPYDIQLKLLESYGVNARPDCPRTT